MGRRGLLITAGTALIVCGALAWLSSARSLLRASAELGTVAYVGSEACTACHDDRHASWQRTFHRTMTQDASASSVRGRFDGQELTAFGGVVRPVTAEGGYAFEYRDASTGAVQATLPVLRTVGSHRYPQYLRGNGARCGLPVGRRGAGAIVRTRCAQRQADRHR